LPLLSSEPNKYWSLAWLAFCVPLRLSAPFVSDMALVYDGNVRFETLY